MAGCFVLAGVLGVDVGLVFLVGIYLCFDLKLVGQLWERSGWLSGVVTRWVCWCGVRVVCCGLC